MPEARGPTPETAQTHLTLEIESIAAGGDGVARSEGLVVFTPRTAIGDRVSAAVTVKGRMARGVVETLEHRGRDRVRPECEHYDADHCGGCQLQHITVPAQREAKRKIISDSMRRIGKRNVAPPEIHAGANAWRYRRKLTLALRKRAGRWIAGLHAYDNPAHVFELSDCKISDERVVAVWRQILAAQKVFPGGDSAARRRASARRCDESRGVRSRRRARLEFRRRLFQCGAVTLRALVDSGKRIAPPARRSSRQDRTRRIVRAGKSGSRRAARIVRRRSGDGAQARDGRRRILRCGRCRRRARRASGVRVVAIELDAEASAWAATRLPAGSRAVTARVEDALRNTLPADVVILNPPRTGVDARVTTVLSNAKPLPRAIVYVSCDPATLARDISRLPGWKIERLTAFDMFPQTAHVETVCELVPVTE